MNNNRISQKQGVVLLVLFFIGTSTLLVTGLQAKMDIWIANLLAIGIGALIMLVYARLMTILPGKDFFEITEHFLGKIGSKIFLVILVWTAFQTSALVLRNYGQFVVTVGLPETPLFVSMITLMAICIIAVRSGIEVIGRWSEIFVLFVLPFTVISILLVSQNIDFSNLQPVLDQGIAPIATGTLSVIAFPIGQAFVFLLAFPAFKKSVSVKKIFLYGLLIGGAVLFITSVTDVLVLGTNIAENMYYPSYTTMSTIHYGDFLHRFEVIATIVFIITTFLKLSILLLGTCKGAARLIGLNEHRPIIVPIAFLIINYALIAYDSMVYFHEWALNVSPYYLTVLQVIIPVLLLIIIEIKRRKIPEGAMRRS